jgi:hypothetical protein
MKIVFNETHLSLKSFYFLIFYKKHLLLLKKMKAVQIGSGSLELYADLKLTKARSENKFGQMFYFSDSIFLIQNGGVTDYIIGQSSITHTPQLTLTLTDDLKKELAVIEEFIMAKFPQLQMKVLNGDKIFLKLSKDCEKIVPNASLKYSIRIYGCYQQKATNTTFLQMEVHEVQMEKISLLTSSLNYVPNAGTW